MVGIPRRLREFPREFPRGIKMSKNSHLRINNTSGIAGVSLSTINGISYWVSSKREAVTGRLKQKYFNIKKMGEQEAKQAASNHRLSQTLK